ncbi:hypothetical protein [Sandaracinus amylolyticus]|uniref:Uncharacterized protein n=1 Tax=Sandaracinus amylolyticus TaxID=927083 RepID=A0A0F6W8P7_9BACT|nr:hypothetical protein [Sandaracinus amylolyticus]AKF10325.1 hypothetical protein DB32_007474 [Sandaracinus amylolyticus]
MADEARSTVESNEWSGRDSGVFEQARPDRARVLLCVLGIPDRATERVVSRALDRLPWTESSRDLVERLMRSEDGEARARALVAKARGEGASVVAEVLREIARRTEHGAPVDPEEARLIGVALGAADRKRAIDIVRAQILRARSADHREMWKRVAVGVAKG